jgi:hypothetical protein
MGIDRSYADFLLGARNDGVDFSRTATLGRLNLFVDHRSMAALFRAHGERLAEAEIRALRDEGYCEAFLRRLGARETVSIDASAYEGASLVHDMNLPIAAEHKRKFSVVIDGGTLEHVFNFPVAIKSCMEMLEVGGHFFAHTMANNFMGHGFYQFSPELFYRVFSPANGFKLHRVVAFEERIGRPRWYEARDPGLIGERVELINGRQTYLLVHAERIADVPIFAQAPQQADYSAHWAKGQPPRYGVAGLRAGIHRWAKAHNEAFLKYTPGFLYDFALSALVRGLPRRGFRRRHFAPLPATRRLPASSS